MAHAYPSLSTFSSARLTQTTPLVQSNPSMREKSSGRWLLPFTFAWSVGVLGVAEWFLGAGLAFRPFTALADPRVGPGGFGALAAHAILCDDDKRRRRILRIGIVLEILRIIFLARREVRPDVIGFSVGYGFF